MVTRFFVILCVIVSSFQTLGCANRGIVRSSSSVPLGQVIQPVKDSRQVSEKRPLALPATVAILALPDKHHQIPNTTLRQAAERLKKQLLAYPKYINSVSVVPEDEIKSQISLDQIRDLYSADVAITLSHQQDQRGSQSGAAGLMDAAIVGLFLVPGVEIKTSSIIDGRVIHIPNRAIVFRATGTDERSTRSTTHSESGTLKEESINGILAATADFGNSLTKILTQFDDYDFSKAVPVSALTEGDSADAKDKPANDYWRKVDTYKSTGGGAFGIVPLLLCAAVCIVARRRR